MVENVRQLQGTTEGNVSEIKKQYLRLMPTERQKIGTKGSFQINAKERRHEKTVGIGENVTILTGGKNTDGVCSPIKRKITRIEGKSRNQVYRLLGNKIFHYRGEKGDRASLRGTRKRKRGRKRVCTLTRDVIPMKDREKIVRGQNLKKKLLKKKSEELKKKLEEVLRKKKGEKIMDFQKVSAAVSARATGKAGIVGTLWKKGPARLPRVKNKKPNTPRFRVGREGGTL